MRNFLLREIENGGYKLDKMLERIKAAASSGAIDIVHDQPYLERRARENARVSNEIDIEKTVLDLVARVKVLEDRLAEGGETVTPDEEDEYPEYRQPTGAHDCYWRGDKMTFGGVRYICDAAEGIPVVYDPIVMPSYWRAVD